MFQSNRTGETSQGGQPAASTSTNKRPQHSIIGTDLKITGDIESSGDITVHGTVEGSIKCRTLTLGDAPVISSVEAETVRISGSFDGEVRAKKVSLTRNAKVKGDIYHESLEVEAGATIEGRLARLESPAAKESDDDSTVTDLKAAQAAS